MDGVSRETKTDPTRRYNDKAIWHGVGGWKPPHPIRQVGIEIIQNPNAPGEGVAAMPVALVRGNSVSGSPVAADASGEGVSLKEMAASGVADSPAPIGAVAAGVGEVVVETVCWKACQFWKAGDVSLNDLRRGDSGRRVQGRVHGG